jgi:Na+-transporting methylmalonyl-CoA/oxaloacetate decarboxylase beta subunit
VLECVDASGNVVKEDPVGFAFLWIGIIAGIGIILAGILAFVFAAPAGILIARLFSKLKKPQ